MGMTYEQYWEQSPYLAVAYRKAYRLKQEANNEYAWLQGLYFCNAVSVSIANAFSKRGSKAKTYFEKPIDIFPLTDEKKKLIEKEEYDKMQLAMEAMIRKQQRDKKQRVKNNG